MEKNPSIYLKEVIIGSTDKALNRWISAQRAKGNLKKIAPRLYTTNLEDSPEVIIRRNLFEVLGGLFPGAMLSHRSAFEYKPTEAGHIFMTYKYTRWKVLPGLVIRFLEGPGPVEGDRPVSGDLFVSQQARAFLENLQVSKQTGPESKVLALPEIEEKLEAMIRIHGDQEINRLRDHAREISGQLDMNAEFRRLDQLIRALLAPRDSRVLTSPLAAARAFGFPYDPARIVLFETLFRELQNREFRVHPENNPTPESFRNFAFFESYFSNYIEGTEFSIEDALNIIESGVPMLTRYEDSHDILGTYKIASNRQEMSVVPGGSGELLSLLRARHGILLSARDSKMPGRFKDRNNVAGLTSFVDKELVQGTLIKGYDLYNALTDPFRKAAFVMFMISEVHPFLDGNGRVARIMMNAELVAAGRSKIMIPTVYRDDYLGALRRLSRRNDPDPYIRMLQRACEFSVTVHGDDIRLMQRHLLSCNAFLEPTEGKLQF